MNTTIAVTLITAISTLAGAGISGFVAFLVSRSQQVERLTAERRQIRRDAYLQFINQLGVVEEILNNQWMPIGPSTEDEFQPFFRSAWGAMSDLRRTENLLILEGPREMAIAAIALTIQLQSEGADIARIVKIGSAGKSIYKYDEDKYVKTHQKRDALKLKVLNTAQNSLDMWS